MECVVVSFVDCACCRGMRSVMSYNSDTLSIFLQLGYTQYKIHQFLLRHPQLGYVVRFSTTRIQVWCTELVQNLYATCTQTSKVLYQATYAGYFGV